MATRITKPRPRPRPTRGCTLDDFRELALALPATTEKPSYGTPGFRVRDKLFARVLDDARVVVFMDLDQREAMLATAPSVFSVTPHYRPWPMVIVTLAAVSRGQLADLLRGSWRQRAPARLLAEVDAGPAPEKPRRRAQPRRR